MNRGLLATLFVCILLAGVGVGAGAHSNPTFAEADIATDDVLLSISVEEDGDAVWTIEYRTRLDTDEKDAAFEDLRTDVDANPESYADRFQDRMEGTAATAENATGREMTISEMTVSAETKQLPQEYGVLTYTFRWSNFAAVDGDRLVAGDAIDGLFLDEETSLLLSWPEGYELRDVSPEPTETRENAVFFEGPTDFGRGAPRIEAGPQTEGLPADSDGLVSISPIVVGAFAGVLLVAGGAIFAYRRREGARETSSQQQEGTAYAEGQTDTAHDSELLSNEEQVLQAIESAGGRMKQQELADRLEWTDAKTSQVTKKLRESGELEGFRLGRENVLSLPDDESKPE